MLRRLVVNTGSNYAFRLFTMALGFISIPVLVNAIGAEGYGVILLAGTVMGYFNLLRGGVPAGTVKYVSEYDARGEPRVVNEIIGSSLMFFLGVGAVAAAGVITFTYFGGIELFNVSPKNHEAGERVLYLAAGLALVSWPGSVFEHALNGLQHYPESNFCKGLGTTVNQLAAIAAALAGQSIEVIFLCRNAGLLLSVGLQVAALRWRLPTWRLAPSHFSFEVLQMIFGYSVWMLLGRVASLLVYQTDKLLLGLFLPVSSLTVYEVITKPFIVVRQMNTLFRSAVTPAVSAVQAKEGRAGLGKFIYTMGKYANAAIAPIAVVAVLLSGPFVQLWMGPEYAAYAWVTQVACFSQLLWYHSSGLNNVLYGAGKVQRIALVGISIAVINVPLGIWWVQPDAFGVAGVILATLAAAALGEVLKYAFVFPVLDVERARYLREAFAGGQWTSWALGLLCIPFWSHLQAIDSWMGLFTYAAVFAGLFYAGVWFFIVETKHQRRAYRYLASLRVQKKSA